MRTRKTVGFGLKPRKPETIQRYETNAKIVADVLAGDTHMDFPELASAISEVKGLFNRALRQDQSDYFNVYERLGLPGKDQLRRIANDLVNMRNAVVAEDLAEFEYSRERLQRNGALTALRHFIDDESPNLEGGAGSLYILQAFKDKNRLLKIGHTTQPIVDRVSEINRATGVAIPYGARHAWRVRNPKAVESRVHDLLAQYRYRGDREFFDIPLWKAVDLIDALLIELKAEVRRPFP
jgi:hypothetical protein